MPPMSAPGCSTQYRTLGPVTDQVRQIGVEHDVHAAGDVHPTLGRQVQVGRHPAATAVGADHVLRPDQILRTGGTVQRGHRHAVVVLDHADVFGVEPDPAAPRCRVADQDRFEQRLRQVAVERRAREAVVGFACGMRTPGADPADLVARQAGAEHRVTHQVMRRGLREDVVLDPHVAEDLDGPLVGDVRSGRVRGPAVLRDDQVLDAVRREEQRGRRSGRTAADDQYIGGEVVPSSVHFGGRWRGRCRRRPGTMARPFGGRPARGPAGSVDERLDQRLLDAEHGVVVQVRRHRRRRCAWSTCACRAR